MRAWGSVKRFAGRRPTRQRSADSPVSYSQSEINQQYAALLPQWIATAARQDTAAKILLPPLLRRLAVQPDDPVLEVGAGVGQLSRIARDHGYSVLASDYLETFVAYMNDAGIPARQIDARHIDERDHWAAVFAQGLSTLITRDMATVRQTYESIHAALRPGGRFLLIFPRGDRNRFSRAADHRAIYSDVGFTELGRFRQQVLPARLYGRPLAGVAERAIGRWLGVRDILVLQK